jgi:hypothetical protein
MKWSSLGGAAEAGPFTRIGPGPGISAAQIQPNGWWTDIILL